ncbi:hypothetical protein ABEG17_16140 [Pedococcus sp. KACC 23699]|uniref:Deoxyribose-phosphate aldolase n=1 Tax=Pedococcus sp. KACC 23699 TaxID=3149228 RepID=A0AAU7JRN4_9MICO
MTGRRPISLGEIASRLEHRLYLTEATPKAIGEEYALTTRHGLSSVIVRPEVVSTVGLRSAGTLMGIVSVPGWCENDVRPLSTHELLTEARRLVGDGATEVGLLADASRLKGDQGLRFVDSASSLVGAMRDHGARVRVVLDTDNLTPDDTVAVCHRLASTGAWLVQGGSWLGARTSLTRIQLMRGSLPPHVRLKWTSPIRTLDAMLICIAEGVDRFNGDPATLLSEAARRIELGSLVVPVRGVDY